MYSPRDILKVGFGKLQGEHSALRRDIFLLIKEVTVMSGVDLRLSRFKRDASSSVLAQNVGLQANWGCLGCKSNFSFAREIFYVIPT